MALARAVVHHAQITLYDEPLSEVACERLKIVYDCNDGFEIARQDLRLRGPGEFLGARQWGTPLLRFADLERDGALLARACEAAETLLAEHPQAAREHMRRWLSTSARFLDA